MPFGQGETVTISGQTFSLAEVDCIKVLPIEVSDNTVLVEYASANAAVYVAGNLSAYVTAEISGAHVTVTQSADVSDTTCGEITYILKGESENGSFVQNGSYKSTIELQGLTLTNPEGASIDIQNGKRIGLSAKNGTENTLSDGTGGKPNMPVRRILKNI